jgi:hypothetical protein
MGGRTALNALNEGTKPIFASYLAGRVGLAVDSPEFDAYLAREVDLGQHGANEADSLNFARRWVRQPFPGYAPRRVLVQEGIGDELVFNALSEELAMVAGLASNVPASDPAGVSGHWIFEPPGGHGIFDARADVRAQAATFLESGGTVLAAPLIAYPLAPERALAQPDLGWWGRLSAVAVVWVSTRSWGTAGGSSHGPSDAPRMQLGERVVAVVPARNEAAELPQTLGAPLDQSHRELHVVLVDDHSTDGTATLARTIAGDHGASARLMILAAPELPPGWTGKVWAQEYGVREAIARGAEWVWLTDADVRHAPDVLDRLLATAHRGRRDFVSVMARLRCATVVEKPSSRPSILLRDALRVPRDANDRTRTARRADASSCGARSSSASANGGDPRRGDRRLRARARLQTERGSARLRPRRRVDARLSAARAGGDMVARSAPRSSAELAGSRAASSARVRLFVPVAAIASVAGIAGARRRRMAMVRRLADGALACARGWAPRCRSRPRSTPRSRSHRRGGTIAVPAPWKGRCTARRRRSDDAAAPSERRSSASIPSHPR